VETTKAIRGPTGATSDQKKGCLFPPAAELQQRKVYCLFSLALNQGLEELHTKTLHQYTWTIIKPYALVLSYTGDQESGCLGHEGDPEFRFLEGGQGLVVFQASLYYHNRSSCRSHVVSEMRIFLEVMQCNFDDEGEKQLEGRHVTFPDRVSGVKDRYCWERNILQRGVCT